MPQPNLLRSAMALLFAGVALAGCSRMSGAPVFGSSSPTHVQQTSAAVTPQPNPVQALEQQAEALNVGGFISASALPLLTPKDKTEASSAQYYALQFGRPGAPRNWSGDTGAQGQVTVGPFIRVNNLDCREFTHAITVSSQTYTRSGTSCREINGEWQVYSAA